MAGLYRHRRSTRQRPPASMPSQVADPGRLPWNDRGGEETEAAAVKEPADIETAASNATQPSTTEPTAQASTTEPTAVLATDRLPAMRLVNGAVKVGLAVSFFVALVLQPEVVEGKAMGFRA
ncbi:MAG: hypothetical protein AAF531_16655, partial [Actinomycetota bacterium]